MGQRLLDEVSRTVASCRESRSILKVGPSALRIADLCEGEVSVNLIVDLLIEEAVCADIPLEIETPRTASQPHRLAARLHRRERRADGLAAPLEPAAD